MSLIISGKRARPRRVLFYGKHGMGKSTWASQAPAPFFLDTEDGLDAVGCERTNLLTNFYGDHSVMWWLNKLLAETHTFQTVVIDSIDWMQKLVWEATVGHGKTMESIPYGKAWPDAMLKWEEFLRVLDALRACRSMNVVFVGHATVVKVEDPIAGPYDSWSPSLHKSISHVIQEWCDEVFFCRLKMTIDKATGAFGKETTRTISDGEREVLTSSRSSHAAKRRIALPDSMQMYWSEYQRYWPVPAAVTSFAQPAPAAAAAPQPAEPVAPDAPQVVNSGANIGVAVGDVTNVVGISS